MKQAFALFWESLKAFWEELFTLALANLCWFAVALGPLALALSLTWFLPPSVVWAGIAASLVTAPPATAGLNLLANEMAHQRGASLSLFWRGFREYFWPALGMGMLNVVLLVVIASNYFFYGNFQGRWVLWVQGAWAAVGLFWAAIQVYLYPFLMEQIPRNVLLPFRNSIFLTLATPLVTFTALVLTTITLALSVVLALPLLAGGISLATLYANKVTVTKLRDFRKLHEPTEDATESP
ncbi:MAG: DUF624 domain-containing protein [Anaerolineae bacterium]|nr:DUF624 domain-containing protein [Anaerolineae bacterium]